MTRIGVDIGGTKTEVVALADGGEVVARRRVATPRGEYREALQQVARLVVGVSRETGTLSNAYALVFNEQPMKRDLEMLLQREVRFANDANCFALSEASDGAARGARVVFGVILGTGVGGGIVVDGKVVEGANSLAGEWGHNPLPWPRDDERPGPRCGCGRAGHIEAFLSGPGLARDYELCEGRALAPAEIVERAAAGAADCAAALARYESRLGRALAEVINFIDPDVIVLGGGLSGIQRLYLEVPRCWADYVYAPALMTRLVPAMHGDASGVRGAAWLWPA